MKVIEGDSRLARKKMKSSTLLFTLALFIATLVIAAAVVFVIKPEWLPFAAPVSTGGEKQMAPAKPSGYVAVFLTNNQVYFGKLGDLGGQYATLSDVYYLRVQRALVDETQGADITVEDKKATTKTPQTKNELTLIKLGDELHGPTDEIKLNRDHILFIEELKDDSKVIKAIEQFKAKK